MSVSNEINHRLDTLKTSICLLDLSDYNSDNLLDQIEALKPLVPITNDDLIQLMELRVKIWREERKTANGLNAACLVASICDVEEDIKTIRRATWIQETYQAMIHG